MPERNVEMAVVTPPSVPGPRVAWAATGFERATSTASLSLEVLCHQGSLTLWGCFFFKACHLVLNPKNSQLNHDFLSQVCLLQPLWLIPLLQMTRVSKEACYMRLKSPEVGSMWCQQNCTWGATLCRWRLGLRVNACGFVLSFTSAFHHMYILQQKIKLRNK